MAVVVLIPTFQRPETLSWSLQSVLLQDTQGIDFKEELRIIILNNDVLTKHLVEDAVKKTLGNAIKHRFKSVTIVHRDPPLLGIFNFYHGLADNTCDGDIAFLHGDDDIMLAGSLAKRYLAARQSNLAFQIAKATGKMFFFKEDGNIYLDSKRLTRDSNLSLNWRQATKDDLVDYSLPFVSAYSYKIGPEFWACYKQARKWADALSLEPKIRLPFLPFYMGLSAWINNQLTVIPEVLIRRGQLLQSRGLLPPRVVTEYANTGIILQTGLAVLNNEDLGSIAELDELRSSVKDATAPYLFFSLFRRDGVSLSQLKYLHRLTKIRWWSKDLLFKIIIGTGSTIFKSVCGINNLRNRLSGWGHRLSPEDFWILWKSKSY